MRRLRKVNRSSAVLRKIHCCPSKSIRKSLILCQPEVVLQNIIYFLGQTDVLQLQCTCSYFRTKYLAILDETSDRLYLKANIYYLSLCMVRKTLQVASHAHLRKIKLRYSYGIHATKYLGSLKNSKINDVDISHTAVDPSALDDALVHLRRLIASSSSIQTTKTFANMLDLRVLSLADTMVSDVLSLRHIHTIDLSGTLVRDVSAFGSASSRVRVLRLCRTKVTDVSALGSLWKLDLSQTLVTNVDALGNIHDLCLRSTDVRDVSKLGKVYKLDLSATEIIDVSALGNVHDLNISNTNIIDVSALGKVHKLNISKTSAYDVRMLGTVQILLMENMGTAGIAFPTTCRNRVLNVSGNKCITSATPFRKVRVLDISSTNISDVRCLSRVYSLNLEYTPASDVCKLTHTRILNISRTGISNLKGLRNVTKITLDDTIPINQIMHLKRAKQMEIRTIHHSNTPFRFLVALNWSFELSWTSWDGSGTVWKKKNTKSISKSASKCASNISARR